MSFLSTLFLLGAAAMSIPILIHMIRRAPRVRFQFSTLRFLSPSPEVMVNKNRVQHWLLMLLRMLIILLISLAFSRPFIKEVKTIAVTEPRACVMFLVDISASMQRREVAEKLQRKLIERISAVKKSDYISVMLYASHVHELISFKKWKKWPKEHRLKYLEKEIKNITIKWGKSDVANALTQASEIVERFMDQENSSSADIELFTDGQKGEGLEKLYRNPWNKNINVIVNKIEASQKNAGLKLIGLKEDKSELKIRLIWNELSDKQTLLVKLTSEGDNYYEKKITNTKENQFLEIPLIALPDSATSFEVLLEGDGEDYDNTLYCVVPKKERRSILYLGDDKEKSKSNYFYLNLFFEGDEFSELLCDELEMLRKKEIKPAFVVVNRPFFQNEIDPIREYLNEGGTVVFMLQDVAMEKSLSKLINEKIKVTQAQADDYLLWGQIDDTHWLFEPFFESKFKDFSSIFFWKYRKVEWEIQSKLKPIATFDNGDPALLSATFGTGELLLFTSSWSAADSQLAINSKFVPLINAILLSAQRNDKDKQQYFCGEGVSFEKPGHYLHAKGSPLAVNVSSAESKMKQLSVEDYQTAVSLITDSDLKTHMEKRYTQKKQLEKEGSSNNWLWQYIIIAVLVMSAIESIVAYVTNKRMDLM